MPSKAPASKASPAVKPPAPAAKAAAAPVAAVVEKAVSVQPSAAAARTINKPTVPTITEAQLRKMGEDDYMNEAQLQFFRTTLVQMREQLVANANNTGEHLRDNEVTTDPADRATQEEEYTIELRARDRERKLLKKVEKSINQIDDGSYGWCEETGEPIGIPRLLARPTASLSLEAQERRERLQKLYG
jgi:DnaK suppressor protein